MTTNGPRCYIIANSYNRVAVKLDFQELLNIIGWIFSMIHKKVPYVSWAGLPVINVTTGRPPHPMNLYCLSIADHSCLLSLWAKNLFRILTKSSWKRWWIVSNLCFTADQAHDSLVITIHILRGRQEVAPHINLPKPHVNEEYETT